MNEIKNAKIIWQPVTNSTDNCLHHLTQSNQQVRQQHFHANSLRSDQENELKTLNRKIIKASQSFNSVPKPFVRQATLPATLQERPFSEQQQYDTTRPFGTSNNQSVSSKQSNSFSEQVKQEQQQQQQNDDMAQKLVHKQYNSPIDLYSMNNIRKTIEAHSELIAPGVKGINFNKSDTPVNKQSEVYKLVMEEEKSATVNKQASLSPISGQSLNLARGPAPYATSEHPSSSTNEAPLIKQQLVAKQEAIQTTMEQRPQCCECGQLIVGPFAKIQNRFVHPQCFNCTTCGTSLKNSGYFTINEKLYCDIHAKQVANLMRINYNFDANRQGHQQSLTTSHHNENQQQNFNQQSATIKRQGQQMKQTYSTTRDELQQHNLAGLAANSSYNTSQATISTMFANLDKGDDCCNRREIQWTWRPATGAESSVSSATMTKVSSSLSEQQQQQVCNNQNNHQMLIIPKYQEMQVSSGKLLQHESVQGGRLLSSGRIPVCVRCQKQIHGPYILAGDSTWCKPCSQSDFICSTCQKSLLNVGFIEDGAQRYYCEQCYELYSAPTCSKCNMKIKGDCLNALGKHWHPSCFVCGHCRRPFGNSSFYLEDDVPYCERDWNMLFTTKCYNCSYPIEAGDKWIEALDRNYHSNCFRCTSCQAKLEGSTFYCKGGEPYCRLHAR